MLTKLLNKYKSLPMPVKASFWFLVCSFLQRGISTITVPIFTRLLTKEQYGLLANFNSWESILTIVITLNLVSTLISAKYDYKDDFDSYIYSAMTLSMLSAGFWLVVTNLCGNFFPELLKINSLYLNIMLINLMLTPVVNLYQARERYNFEYKKTVFISVVLTLCSALLSILLDYYMQNRLTGRIIGSALPSIVIGFGIFLHFLKRHKLKFSFEHCGNMPLRFVCHIFPIVFR